MLSKLNRTPAGARIALVLGVSALLVGQLAWNGDDNATGPRGGEAETPVTVAASSTLARKIESHARSAKKQVGADKRLRRASHRRQATPQARAERRRSQTAYKNLSASQARTAVAETQTSTVENPAWQPPSIEPGAKVVGYADTQTALLDMPGDGPNALVASTRDPIALPNADGALKPIDLQLRESDEGLRPHRSQVPLLVPKKATDDIVFGDSGPNRVRLSLGGASSRSSLVGGGEKAFFANTQTDTDTIVEAVPLGAEISWALRSPASPSALPMDFDGSASKFTMMADGSVSFDGGALGEGIIGRPAAWDAQGREVKTRLVLGDRGVVVAVEHHDAGLAYPVIVDPAVTYGGVAGIRDDAGLNVTDPNDPYYGQPKPLTNGGGASPFSWSTTSSLLTYSSTAQLSGYQMKIAVGTSTTGSQTANLIYDAPRTASIFRVAFVNVSHVNPKYTALRVGLINSGGSWESQAVGWTNSGCPNGCWAGGPYFENTPGMPSSTVEACATGACGLGGSPDNKALFQLAYNRPAGSSAPTTSPYVQTRGAYVYFSDYTAPTLDFGEFQNLPAAGWSKNLPNPKFRALVTDTGVGVGNASLGDGYGNFYHHASAFDSKIDGVSEYPSATRPGFSGVGPGCIGGWSTMCPLVYERPNTEVALQDGTHTYDLTGADIVGNKTTHSYVFHTDRQGPEVDLSGRLGAFALDSAALGTGEPRTVVEDAPFVIQAFDGRRTLPSGGNAPAKDNRSGVKLISAKVYGSNADGTINLADVKTNFDASNTPAGPKTSSAASCDPAYAGNSPTVNNSCKLSYGGTFNGSSLGAGIYYFRVHAEDYAGNVTDKDFKVAVGVASLNTVVEGQASSRYVPIQVKRERGSATQATIQFRTALNAPWCNVDSSTGGVPGPLVPENSPTSPTAGTVAVDAGGTSANYVLDLDALRSLNSTCGNLSTRLPDGKLYVRALMSGSGSASTRASEDVTIRYDHGGRGSADATQGIGPGSVDLVTGNFSMSATDVSVDAYKSDLTVSRTYNSRYYNESGPLGPGWELGVDSDSAGTDYTGLFDNADVGIPDDERYPTVEVDTSDGDTIVFELTGVVDHYRAQDGSESLELERIPDAADSTRTAGFKIHDRDSGTVTSFKPMTGGEDPGEYEVADVYQPGTSDQITYAYADDPTLGNVVRYAFAPAAGLTCRSATASADQSFDNLLRGCQALRFNYETDGYPNRRLTSIEMKAWDPATSAMVVTAVSRYAYDSQGRLIEQWDPRITPALKTTYGILNTTDSRIVSVKPAGEDPYVINYLKLAEDPDYGRLNNVQRTPSGGSTATWTTRFYVPTQGTSAPFNFSESEVNKWGQVHPPFIGAAVFAPDQPPNGTPATNYDRASLIYMDPLGRTVNTRDPGDRITTTEYDKWGEVVRTLGAENRARALAESTPAARVASAQKWDVENEYAPVPGTLDSRRHLTRTIGPEHQIRVDDGTWLQARNVTDYTYDEGSPIAGDSTKEPFDLVTTQTESALVDGNLRDSRTTKTSYGDTEAEWKLRIPRLTTTDPSGLQIKQKVSVGDDGLVTERFQPRSQNSNQPSTTRIVYYSAGNNTEFPECGNHAEWLGLACRQGPGAQPTTPGMAKLPVKTITYNYLRQPLTLSESVVDASGATKTRTTTKTYDAAGRALTEDVSSSVGTGLNTTSHVYSTTTGRETQTRSMSGSTVIKSITRAFDSLGRQTNYTDGEGHASSVTYDLLSRPLTEINEKATRTNYYDPITGDLTYVNDSGAGEFTGVYDADGRLVGTVMPGGIAKSFTFDAAGTPTYTAYTRMTGCSSNCLLYQQSGVENAHGQYWGLTEDVTGQESTYQLYDYDAAGRLVKAQDNRISAGTTYCTQREYSLDADSNRLSKASRPETAGSCATSGGTTQSNTFDDADRVTNSGYAYDAFGRITSAPAADTGGSTAFTASYYVNDLARSITQDGLTQTFDLDPMQRVSVKTKSGSSSSTESYAYTDDSDSPAFTQTGTTWNRTVDGIAGTDMAQDSANGLTIMIENLRGDVVAQSTTSGTLSGFSRVDEFGVPKSALPAGSKYAFHGSKQREALTPGGTVAMGVRLYQPQTGRFLAVDSVLGGTAGPYEYPSDPVNVSDLDGRKAAALYRGYATRRVAQKLINWLRAKANWAETYRGSACVVGGTMTGFLVTPWTGALVGSICAGNLAAKVRKMRLAADRLSDYLIAHPNSYGVKFVLTEDFQTASTKAGGLYVRAWNPKVCFPMALKCTRVKQHSYLEKVG